MDEKSRVAQWTLEYTCMFMYNKKSWCMNNIIGYPIIININYPKKKKGTCIISINTS